VTYRILIAPPARRALEQSLPESVAAAVWAFIQGPLAQNPHRVGKELSGSLAGSWSARRGEYRVVYRIDEEIVTVTILRIGHRRAIYR